MSSGENIQNKPRRKPPALLTAGVIAAAGVLPQCTSVPKPRPEDTAQNWTIPADIPAGQQKLLGEYKTAYQVFEKTVDDVLREAKDKKDALSSLVFGGKLNVLGGLKFVFIPSDSEGKPGSCYLAASSKEEKRLMEFPALVRMFDAYQDLWKACNAVGTEVIVEKSLPRPPTSDSLRMFLDGRIDMLPPQQTITHKDMEFISTWLIEPWDAACAFTGAHAPLMSATAKDMEKITSLLEENRPWKASYDGRYISFTDEYDFEHSFPMPNRHQIMELKQRFLDGTYGGDVVDRIASVVPLADHIERTCPHKLAILKFIEIPVEITVKNSSADAIPSLANKNTVGFSR